MKLEERFLNYVSYCTSSNPEGTQNPTTEQQFALARVLEAELKEIGLINVHLSNTCYVYGLLPATKGMEDKKAIGLIAHMDTSPDFPAEHPKPQIIPCYDGTNILLKGSNTYLKVSDFPHLTTLKGHRLITTDGTTLLGADDKAGIAEIVTAIDEIKKNNIPHGDIWVCFTPDEEVAMGTNNFDFEYFKADYAYTVDGAYEGDIAYENFNAASAIFTINGISVHPGEAKDVMVNAALIGCELAMSLPEKETPAHTEDREGFFHLNDLKGDVVCTKLSYIVRDHDKTIFESRLDLLRSLEQKFNEKYGEGTVILNIKHSYSNMLSIIEKQMYIVDLAKDAIRSVGLEPVSCPVRGGTDGARLSFMGLPCPNLGTGGYAVHGPYEHVSVTAMQKMVDILKFIIANPIN
ncbi:MAG: peptidase T [Lachnospiraceae bacterium]|nr:peptidase T [Lachnospiraceae bacterium]